VAIGRRGAVNGLSQIQGLDHGLGSTTEDLAHGADDSFLRNLSRAKGINSDGHRLGNADGVGQLNLTAACQPRSHDVLGDVAAHVSCAAVHLAGILPGEGAAAVVAGAAIGVHDDLAAREARVAHGPAHHEAPRGVHVIDGVRVQQLCGQGGLDDVLQDAVPDGVLRDVLIVLGGDDHRVDPLDLIALKLDRHLGLAIRTQPRELVVLADLR